MKGAWGCLGAAMVFPLGVAIFVGSLILAYRVLIAVGLDSAMAQWGNVLFGIAEALWFAFVLDKWTTKGKPE